MTLTRVELLQKPDLKEDHFSYLEGDHAVRIVTQIEGRLGGPYEGTLIARTRMPS